MKAVISFASAWSFLLASVAGVGAGELAVPTGPAAAAVVPGGPRWRVGLGVQWRAMDRLSLQASPHANLGVVGNLVDAPRERLPANGPEGATGDRRYVDGFVYADEGTVRDGTTWWWGYQSASQVQGDTLSFTAEGDYTTATSSGREAAWDQGGSSEDGFGPVLEVEADWAGPGDWRLGMAFSFSYLGLGSGERDALFSGRQQSLGYSILETDRYALQGVVVPSAPYEGSRDGPGPVIDNLPARSRRDTLVRQREARFESVTEIDFGAQVYNFSLGSTLAWERGCVSLQGSAALELDVVSWDLASREILTASGSDGSRRMVRWQDRAAGTAMVPGLGLGARAAWQWRPGWDLAGVVKWRAMENLAVDNGKTAASLNSGGWSLGLTLGYNF